MVAAAKRVGAEVVMTVLRCWARWGRCPDCWLPLLTISPLPMLCELCLTARILECEALSEPTGVRVLNPASVR